MNESKETPQFFQHFFNDLNDSKIKYCVLRNYDNLPYSFGKDVDMWVRKKDENKFEEILFNIARKFSWEVIRNPSINTNKVDNSLILLK